MAILNFTLAYASTLAGLEGQVPSITVYAEDLGNCAPCVESTGSCWPCLVTSQQVFNDSSLTSPVADGYYLLKYSNNEQSAIWHIHGGYPQTEGFFH
jgi:hypothetical protein